jgi:hypothetical protein
MGVAAVDVPLFEFERLFHLYRIGVGGYAFVIDTNGNILTHPDFRPFVSLIFPFQNFCVELNYLYRKVSRKRSQTILQCCRYG